MDKRTKYSISDYVGKSFGLWTVTGFSHKDKNRTQNWWVKCQCGESQVVLLSNLLRGTSIGCKKCGSLKNRGLKNSQWTGERYISGSFFGSVSQSAKSRGIDFGLTIKEVDKLICEQKFKCAYTGLDITFSQVQSGSNYDRVVEQTASLDRLDSSKGYFIGNVQFVHKSVNLMKWDLTEKRFLETINKIYKSRFDSVVI